MNALKSFEIGSNDAGQRLDKFLRKAVPGLPESLLYKGIRQKNIKVNKKRCQPGDLLSEGDLLQVYLPDDLFTPRQHPFLGAKAELDIVYEDDHLLLCNKPQGLLVHEGEGHSPDTLIGRVQHHLFKSGWWDPARENSFAPALCNRIDRNTSGIVIAAKTFPALQVLTEKIRQRQVDKLYLAIVHGAPKAKSGLLKGYLQKDERAGRVQVSTRPLPGGKTALTKYRVLDSRGGKSLVEAELLTGRTHQIRAQFAEAGFPLWGDAKYGDSRENRQLQNRQALCAYKVVFSFTTPAGPLDYLKGKSFSIRPPFEWEPFPLL